MENKNPSVTRKEFDDLVKRVKKLEENIKKNTDSINTIGKFSVKHDKSLREISKILQNLNNR